MAKGFSQIPGVDFKHNYSPVVNDVIFRVAVARMLIEILKGKVVDIDNAFLNDDMEHEIYMKIPEGYDEVINPRVDKEDCLILQKAIYGLVQASRQFWKKIVNKMQEGGFKLSEVDPCMLYKEDEKGVCSIIIYIDDMLIIGKEEATDDAIRVLQCHFQVKDPTSLEDYFGVQIVQSNDGNEAWLGQPTSIKSLEKQFGEKVAKKKMTITPGTPGLIGGKVDDISKVDEKTQSMYRSGVGTLVYLTKHSRSDITNRERELPKKSFQEAWWDPDLISREKWREAIRLEFKKILDMGVWRHVKRNDRPSDRRWVFKVKRNGLYRARLVAKGFSQIPGVDFTDNYSPVVNDVTFRALAARMIIENMKGKVVDIDNAFLNGDLEHEIYMKIPEGYDEVINPRVDKKIV